MNLEQRALRFPSGAHALIGIVDVPERPLVRGMLLLHDSGQYRTGSHRQFTLLSRLLAARGVAVLRFDRGASGDSSADGEAGTRTDAQARAQDRADLDAAMKELFMHVPEMKEAVIFAAGDTAMPALAHAAGDARVSGLVLLEPVWPVAMPRAGAVVPRAGAADRLFRRASAFRRAAARAQGAALAAPAFNGELLVIGGDSAREPGNGPARSARARHVALPEVDHAFGRGAWRDAVALACASWLTSW